MSTPNVLAVVAIVVMIVIGVATVLATRQWGSRRRRAVFDCEARTLLPSGGASSSSLKITFRNVDVPDPHLVTIRLRNLGPRDITSTDFDAQRPVRVDLGCTMFGLTSSSHASSTSSSALGGPAFVELRPMLLRRGEEWSVEAVVSGVPKAQLDSSLIDTDIEDGAVVARRLVAGDVLQAAIALGGPIDVLAATARVLAKRSARG